MNNIFHITQCEITRHHITTDVMWYAVPGSNYEISPPARTYLNLNLIKPSDLPSNSLMFGGYRKS